MGHHHQFRRVARLPDEGTPLAKTKSLCGLYPTETVEGKTRVRFAGMTAVCREWRGVPHLTVVPEPLVEVKAASATPEGKCKVRHCNRHDDCDAADAKVKTKYDAATPHEKAHLPMRAEHCDDETCEDCFGS